MPQYPSTWRSQLFSGVPIAPETFMKSSAVWGQNVIDPPVAGLAQLSFAAKIVQFENQLRVGSSRFCHSVLRGA